MGQDPPGVDYLQNRSGSKGSDKISNYENSDNLIFPQFPLFTSKAKQQRKEA